MSYNITLCCLNGIRRCPELGKWLSHKLSKTIYHERVHIYTSLTVTYHKLEPHMYWIMNEDKNDSLQCLLDETSMNYLFIVVTLYDKSCKRKNAPINFLLSFTVNCRNLISSTFNKALHWMWNWSGGNITLRFEVGVRPF